MDPSALIFITLAVAWAVYLVPKALEHHEQSVRARTVERFSATMRVLARREPVGRRRARLVPTPAERARRQGAAATSTSGDERPAPARARVASAGAAARRRRVLMSISAVTVLAVVLAALSTLAWAWVALPVGLLVAWLVACRVMVSRERKARRVGRPVRRPMPARTATPTAPARSDDTGAGSAVADQSGSDAPSESEPEVEHAGVTSGAAGPDGPDSWDPVPVTLPTYVSKPAAPRTVRTIDLDSTGVWTSGRTESDSELVRESQARDDQRAGEQSARRRRA